MIFDLLPPPGKTQGFNDLESLARLKQSQTIEAIDAIVTQPEPAFPEAYNLSNSPEEYAGHLATLLTTRVDEENRLTKTKLIHNSVKLGALLGQQLLRPRFFAVSMEPIIREYSNNLDGLVEFVLRGPVEYLFERPALGELVNRYKQTLTADADEQGLVTHVTGLTMLHIDMHQFDLYVENRMRTVDSELRAWQDDPDS